MQPWGTPELVHSVTEYRPLPLDNTFCLTGYLNMAKNEYEYDMSFYNRRRFV